MSKKLINQILKDLGLNLEFITIHKDYITVANKDRKFMKHYKIK